MSVVREFVATKSTSHLRSLANGPECIEVRATLPYNGLLGKSPPVSDMPTNRTSACRHSEEEPQGADSFRVADYSSRIGGIGVGTGEWSHGLTPVRENPLPRRSTVRRAHLQSADKKEDALRLFLETRNHFKPAFFAGKLMLPTQSCLQSEWALLDTFPGQEDGKNSTTLAGPGAASHSDGSSMLGHNPFDYPKAQASAFFTFGGPPHWSRCWRIIA